MTRTKKLLAAFIAVIMIIAVFPAASMAKSIVDQATETSKLQMLDKAWESIEAVEKQALATKASPAEITKAAFNAALNNPLVDKGSLVWEGTEQFAFTVDGMHCVFCYRARNAMHVSSMRGEAAEALTEITKGSTNGYAQSKNVLLVGPYYSSDSSFTDQYKNEADSIAAATGGTCTKLVNANATGPAIAAAYTDKGVVIYDSHGTQSGTSSYLCLTTNSGITTTDYNNGWAVSSGSAAFIDGRYIENHVSGTLSNCLVWMAICEGMKKAGQGTTGYALIRAGAAAVYGYSQSVSFTGDYKYEATFWTEMKNGATVKNAIATMKNTWGIPDPVSGGDAYPILMSSVDSFPSNPDGAQTVNCDWELFGTSYTVTATSNNTNYGTVSVSGNTITASPKTGYYAAGYTVTSGTATVTQNGNVFTVNPSSDCTVRINFAARETNTVNFVASGTNVGSQTAYSGDAITLPNTVSVTADGWTFNGWVAQQIAETTTKPTFYAPGASYTVTGNATLYALYTRFEEGTGDDVYQLVDTLEDGGQYIIVDSTAISGTTGYAVGNTIVASSHYLNAVSATINDDTCTVSASSLASVVWQAASVSGGWTFYNVAVGKYMGLDSSEYLYPSSTALAWAYTSAGYLDNQTDSEGYYYLSYDSTNGRYTTNKSGKVINFYKLTQAGTIYYTTDPVAVVPTYYTVTFKDWNGAVISTQEVLEGSAATAPADPTREGYTFAGWDVDFSNVTSDLIVTATYTKDPVKGDLNCDGVVDFDDVALYYSYLTNSGTLTAEGLANADYNGDGKINTADVSAVYRFLLGL